MNYCYLRISTSLQDEQNQRQGVENKAKQLGIKIDKYIIDKVSGTKEPSERNLGRLLRKMKKNDIIIVSEISRLARRLMMLFRIVEIIQKKEVKLYSVKENFALDNSIQSTVIVFAFGLASSIERDMITLRTKEALAYKKAQGVKLGRPVGSKTKNHKLNPYKDKIIKLYNKGWSKSKLARKFKVCNKTMRKYIKENI